MAVNRGLAGGQNRWDDMRFAFTRDKQGQASKPDFDFTNLGLLFPQNDATEIVYLIAQMPHDMVLGSDLSPHIHFVQDEAQQPTFKMDYRWYENGGDPTGAFTTITAATFAFTYVAGSLFQIAIFPDIVGSGILSISSFMDIRIYRDDNVVAGDVLAKEFDMHYLREGWGSRQEFAK